MKYRKKLVFIAIGIICLVIIINLLKKDLWDVNEALLREKVLSIEHSDKTVNLLDITPFEWEVVYSFQPYTPKDEIYKTVGYKWDTISETVSEGMNQIVFLNDGKVVCYLYGYPENNGYGISFKSSNYSDSVFMLQKNDHVDFKIERSDSIVFLRN